MKLDLQDKDNVELYKILNGDMFKSLSEEEKRFALELVQDGQLLEDLWKIHYKEKPIKAVKYLKDPFYVGENADYIYDFWLETYREVFDPASTISELILSGAIGYGKSTAGLLGLNYINYVLSKLKNPQKYYRMTPMSPIYLALFSITLTKSNEALLIPYEKLLLDSQYFQYVRDKDLFNGFSQSHPDLCPYTKGNGMLTFPNNVHIVAGSQELHVISLNIIASILDEAEFRKGTKNKSFEEAFSLYIAMRERIRSRFITKLGYLSILISSKRYTDSPVEKYIAKTAIEDKTCKIISKALWDVKPLDLTGERFSVFIGSKELPAKLLEDPEEKVSYTKKFKDLVVKVPIEFHFEFDTKLYTAIRNIAGRATNAISHFINDRDVINDVFRYNLIPVPNIKSQSQDSFLYDMLVVNEVITQDFVKNTILVRAPKEPRFIHIDLSGRLNQDNRSDENDSSAIACYHKELKKDGQIMYVSDFGFAIHPDPIIDINYDAIIYLIERLNKLCRIIKVSADQYQSKYIIDYCKNKLGIKKSNLLSIDGNPEYSYLFRSKLYERSIIAGANEIYEDELVYLEDQGGKINHVSGKSKDIVDSNTGAFINAFYDNSIPVTIFKLDNKKIEERNFLKEQLADIKKHQMQEPDVFMVGNRVKNLGGGRYNV